MSEAAQDFWKTVLLDAPIQSSLYYNIPVREVLNFFFWYLETSRTFRQTKPHLHGNVFEFPKQQLKDQMSDVESWTVQI